MACESGADRTLLGHEDGRSSLLVWYGLAVASPCSSSPRWHICSPDRFLSLFLLELGARKEGAWLGGGWGVRGGGPILRPIVMRLAETQSDGPPGKSIPGILQEQQQNLGTGTPAGFSSKHSRRRVFQLRFPETSPCVLVCALKVFTLALSEEFNYTGCVSLTKMKAMFLKFL